MSSINRVIAFLPCRRGSERVKQKNTRPFAGIIGGLTRIKLQQLLQCPEIDSIVVSTDDHHVMEIVESLREGNSKPIILVERPAHLAKSETSTDQLISHVPEIISEGLVLWTHVTSPFVDQYVYSRAISAIRNDLSDDNYDSLMSVTKVQTFIWNYNGPVNYDRGIEKWPRTQTLQPLFEINSAIFIADTGIYRTFNDRVGCRPFLFQLNHIESIDIDWEEDFIFAERIWATEKAVDSIDR